MYHLINFDDLSPSKNVSLIKKYLDEVPQEFIIHVSRTKLIYIDTRIKNTVNFQISITIMF